MNVTYVVPHSPGAVGYDSADDFLSFAAYHQRLCELTADRGHDVSFYFMGDSEETTRRDGYEVREFPVTVGDDFGSEFSLSLSRQLLAATPDVVHVHGFHQRNVVPLLLALDRTDATVVVQNHGQGLDYSKRSVRLGYRVLGRFLTRYTDKVLSVNHRAVRNLTRAGVSDDLVAHLPNGVDTSLFAPADGATDPDGAGIPPDGPTLLCVVGRIERSKGIQQLLEAVAVLADSYPDLHLTVVYGGAEEGARRDLDRTVADHALQDRVRFAERVPREELPGYYNAADICVFPSIKEGFGVVTLEAMSCARPVVATTSHTEGGHVSHRENAMIADTASPADLALQICLLVEDEPLRDRIRTAARRTVENRYTWAAIGDQLHDHYRDALGADRSR